MIWILFYTFLKGFFFSIGMGIGIGIVILIYSWIASDKNQCNERCCFCEENMDDPRLR